MFSCSACEATKGLISIVEIYAGSHPVFTHSYPTLILESVKYRAQKTSSPQKFTRTKPSCGGVELQSAEGTSLAEA